MSKIDDLWNSVGAPSSNLTVQSDVDALWNSASPQASSSFDFLSQPQEQEQRPPEEGVDKTLFEKAVTPWVAGPTDLIDQFARAYRLGNIPETEAEQNSPSYLGKFANWLIVNQEQFEKDHPEIYQKAIDETEVGRWYREGARSVIPSLGASLPGAAVGAWMGGPVGAIAGYALSGGTIFGLAQYDQVVDDVVKWNEAHVNQPELQIPKDVYRSEAFKQAIVEGGFEAANDLIESKVFGLGSALKGPVKETLRSILQQGWKGGSKNFLLAQAKAQPAEILTEMAQQGYQAHSNKEMGITSDDPWDVAVDAIGPTAMSTLMLGLGFHSYNARQRSKILKNITDPEVDFDKRFDAMRTVYAELKKMDADNGTNLAEKWGQVAQQKLLDGEAIDIDESIPTMKTLDERLAEKEQAAAAQAKQDELDADVAKFEERGKPREEKEEEVPLTEQEKMDNDKQVRQTMGFETRDLIYNKLLEKGFDQERAYELAARIMGSKEPTPVKPPTEPSTILDERGEPIQKTRPQDSTSGASNLSLGERLIQNLPDNLKNQLVLSAKGGFFSSPGAAKATLKKQGLSDTYSPFAIGEGMWVGAPTKLAQMSQDFLNITSGKTAPRLYVPDNLKETPVQETVETPTNVNIFPTDLTNKGKPFTNKISAIRAIARTMKEMKIDEPLLEPVQIAQGQWVARQKKNITKATTFESAAEYVTRRNPEYLEASKESSSAGLAKLDEIIKDMVEQGHENTRPHKGLVRRREMLVNAIARETQEQKTKEKKDDSENKERVSVEKQDNGEKPEQTEPEQGRSAGKREAGGVVQEAPEEREVRESEGSDKETQGEKQEVETPKQEVETPKQEKETPKQKIEKLKASVVEKRLKAGENVPDAEVNKFKTLKLRWSRNKDGNWEEHEPEYKTKKTLTPEEREKRDDLRAIAKAERMPKKETKTVSANDLLKKAHKELLKIKNALEAEKDKDKRGELKSQLESARQDIRILANRVLQKGAAQGIKWFGDQSDVTTNEHPLAKHIMYQSPVMAQTQVDAYTVLEPDTGRRMLKKMSPITVPRAFASMINYAMHYSDGTVDFTMVQTYLKQLKDALNQGKLDNYLDRDDRNAKIDFSNSLDITQQYLRTVLDHLVPGQVTLAEQKEGPDNKPQFSKTGKRWFHFTERTPVTFEKDRPIFLTTESDFGEIYDTGVGYAGDVDINQAATIDDLRQIVAEVKEQTGFDADEEVFKRYGQDEESAPADVVRFPQIRRALEAKGFDAVFYLEPQQLKDYEALVIWDASKLVGKVRKPRFSVIESLPDEMQKDADEYDLTYNGEMGVGEKKIYLFTEPKYGATFTVKPGESIKVNLKKKIADFENAGNTPIKNVTYYFSRLTVQLSPMAQKAKSIFGTDNDPRGIGKYLFPDGSYSSGANLPENQGIRKADKGYVFDGMEHADVYRLYDNARPSDGYDLIPKFLSESGCIRMQLYTAYRNNKETFEDLFVEVGQGTRVTQAQLNQLKLLLDKGNGTLVYEITAPDGKQVSSGETHSVNDLLRELAETRFSKQTPSNRTGIPIPTVQAVVDKITDKWVNKPWFVTVETRSQLPDEILCHCAEDDANVRIGGVTYGDTIYLVADELLSKQDVARVILHEAIGHYGIAGTLGSRFNDTLLEVYEQFKDELGMKEIVRVYQYDTTNEADKINAGAEFLAYTAEVTDFDNIDKTLWQKITDKIREILRSFGFDIKLNDADIRSLLADSYRFVTKNKMAGEQGVQNFFATKQAPVQTSHSTLLKTVTTRTDMPTKPGSLQMKQDVLYKGQPWFVKKPQFSRVVDYSDRTKQNEQNEFPGSNAKEFFTEEARIMLKTLAQQLPKNSPPLRAPARYLLSPEWYDHPIVQKIVRAAIDRHDRYYELFNHLNEFGKNENGDEVVINGETNIIDLAVKLKHKGLTRWQILKNQTSKEYDTLERVVDEGDTGDWKQQYDQEALPSYMEHLKNTGVPKDVIELYSLYRKQYDKALEFLIEPMDKLVTAIDAQAAKDRTKPKYPTFTVTNEHGKMVQIDLREVVKRMGQLRGTYAPRLREIGEWVVEGSRGSKHVRYHKATQYGAQALRRVLMLKGYDIKPVYERERLSENVYSSLRLVDTANAIKHAIDKMDYTDPDLKAKFNEDLLQEVADLLRVRGYRSSMVARKPGEAIRGYITDPNERFVRYINNIAAGIAKSEAAEKMFKHLTGYIEGEGEDKKKIAGIDPAKDRRAYDTATQYITEQLRNSDSIDRAIGFVKSLATFKYLGFNLRSPLVNITSLVTTVPVAIHTHVLHNKGSMFKIATELKRASGDYKDVMLGKKLDDTAEQGLVDEIKLKGYDTPQYTRDAVGTIQRAHGKAWAKTMQYAMYIFGKSEQWIRGTTILASYRLAKKHDSSLTETELHEIAHNASNKAHGIYGKATQLAVGQGTGPGARLAQVLYTYAKFPHNYIQLLYDAGVKKKDIKAFTYGLLSSVILGGAEVMMFKSTMMAIAGAILRALGDDDDPEKSFWDWINTKVGNFGERTLRHGVLGATNVDVSSSMSIGVGVPKDFYELFGIAGGLTKDVQDAAHFLHIGQVGRATEKLIPTAFANVLKAYRELKGITNSKGQRVWTRDGQPYIPSKTETGLRVIGIRSADEAIAQERTWELNKEITNYKKRRDNITAKYRDWLITEGTEEELNSIMDDVTDYNDAVAENEAVGEIPMITRETLKSVAKGTFVPRKNILIGLGGTPE
jgi:hypothetical protein